MKTLKYTIGAIVGTCLYAMAIGQSPAPKDSFNIAGGKWIVCTDTAFVDKFNCAKPTSGFEFSADGSYKEYSKTPTDPNKPFLQGKWTLNGKTFTIDQDDTPGTKEFPKTYTINWVDKNRFYANDKVGQAGPPMYVYFQRLP